MLYVDVLSVGFVFLLFGVGFLFGLLLMLFCICVIGVYVNLFGMGLEIVGFVGFVGLIDVMLVGMLFVVVLFVVVFFVIGFG